MGRLDDIIDRNKHPRKHRRTRFPIGIMLSAFVLLILVLFIFTDLAMPPADKPAPPNGDKRVDGVLLVRPKATRDAGVGSAVAPGSAQPR